MSELNTVFHSNSRKPFADEEGILELATSLRVSIMGKEKAESNLPLFQQPVLPVVDAQNIPRALDIIRYGMDEAIRIAKAQWAKERAVESGQIDSGGKDKPI